jgi:N-acetyl sugar amidotransferase
MHENNNLEFFENNPMKTVQFALNYKFKNNYKICKKCVFDNSIEEITFDENGVCIFCNSITSRKKNKRNNLINLILQIKKNKNKKSLYDCIVGISGGVDSSYVAIKCKEYGLNALLVHFDNGWNTEKACKNIEVVQKYTDFDLVTHVVDWEEFRDLQFSFLKGGLLNFEAPSDHGIFASIYNLALKEKVKYIITGVNSVTEDLVVNSNDENLIYCFGYLYHDLHHLNSVNNLFFPKNKLKTFQSISLFKRKFYESLGFFKTTHILEYLDYNKEDAINALKSIGWLEYSNKHYESIITRFHQSFILPVKFGRDKRMWHLSSLIWSGQISREFALEKLRENICDPKILVQDYYFFLKKFNLTEIEFKKLLQEDNKKFSAYPNRYWLIKFLKKIRELF